MKPARTLALPLWFALAAMAAPLRTAAAEETGYVPGYCGGPHGTTPPVFHQFSDVPVLLGAVGSMMQQIEVARATGGPVAAVLKTYQLLTDFPTTPWHNWYREADQRVALAKLAVNRGVLDANNLWDMYVPFVTPANVACDPATRTNRTIDGTCNDQTRTWMGARGVRFGRNVPLVTPAGTPNPAAYPDYANLLQPNPREVSRKLFTRDTFKPVPFLNMLAAAWVQFQIHDWFDHGENDHRNFFQVPLASDDPIRREHGLSTLLVPHTAQDETRSAQDAWLPPSYRNDVTHWWDASQVYGSDLPTSYRLRTFRGGKLKVDGRGLLPVAGDGFEDAGMRRNWWVGLALMHTLFAHEHNAIADRLAARYPHWTDQELYDKARLINAALIAKIHTLEWTPAIIPNPTLEVGMNANWGGINRYVQPPFDPADVPAPAWMQAALPALVPVYAAFRPVIFGVVGGQRDLKTNPWTLAFKAQMDARGIPFDPTIPFTMSQEFVSVYRMHTLIPDAIRLTGTNGRPRGVVQSKLTRMADGRRLLERIGAVDLLHSFGLEHPGQLVLHNYPEFLQNLKLEGQRGRATIVDMGTVDVLRDRERGVPRYNEFRRQLFLPPLSSIDQLTDDAGIRAALEDVYGHDAGAIERVDLLVGTLAEGHRPTCYGFGETLFQVFTLVATRRLQGDRFYTDDYRPEVYTPEGMAWIANATMKSVLLRHYPELGKTGLAKVTNAFYPWK